MLLDVHVKLIATNERIDIIEQGIDLAIRVRHLPLEDSDLVVCGLDAWEHVLVASSVLLNESGTPQNLEDLFKLPSIGFNRPKHFWDFRHISQDQSKQITFHPRLKTDSFSAMKTAVLASMGIASLPKIFVKNELKSGELIELCPEWKLPEGAIHVAYASRQGMLPAVRELLNFLIEKFKKLDVI